VRRRWIEQLWGAGGIRLLLGDVAVIALLAGATGALFHAGVGQGEAAGAQVEVSGRRALDLDLGRDGVFEVAGPLGTTRIEVRDRRLRVLSSPCPRQLCRHEGWIGGAGQVLVCVPNGVVIRLPGRPPGGVDAVSR
jgi:hypothetical protein